MTKHSSTGTGLARLSLGLGALSLVLILFFAAAARSHSAETASDKFLANVPAPVPSAGSLANAPAPIATDVSSSAPAVPATEVQPQHPRFPTSEAREVKRGEFGSWRYSATRFGDGAVAASVSANIDTVQALRVYAADNRALAGELAQQGGEARVDVSFRTYLSPDQFRAWVLKNGLHVTQVIIRITDANGPDITAAHLVRPDDTDPLPASSVADLVNNPGGVGPFTLRGIYSARGIAAADKLPQIAADPLVFVADVTTSVTARELKKSGFGDVNLDFVLVDSSPFFEMERLGLSNFEK